MHEVLAFLKNNGTFHLATAEGGQPRVRPFGAVSAFEDRLYFVTNNQKDVYKQMRLNPKVELCCMGKDGASWLRVAAEVVFDPRKEAKEQMLADNPSLQALYSVEDGRMEVFYLKEATATFATFTGEPKTVTF